MTRQRPRARAQLVAGAVVLESSVGRELRCAGRADHGPHLVCRRGRLQRAAGRVRAHARALVGVRVASGVVFARARLRLRAAAVARVVRDGVHAQRGEHHAHRGLAAAGGADDVLPWQVASATAGKQAGRGAQTSKVCIHAIWIAPMLASEASLITSRSWRSSNFGRCSWLPTTRGREAGNSTAVSPTRNTA